MGTSSTPGGPYKFVGMDQPTAASLGPHNGFKGDEALFVDDDGQAYIILTHGIAGAGHRDSKTKSPSQSCLDDQSSAGMYV